MLTATHFTTDPEGDEVFCAQKNDWVSAYMSTSDTGPAEVVCTGCANILVDNHKPATPHHIHLGEQWFCRGNQGLLVHAPDYTHKVGFGCYRCSECPAAFELREFGEYPSGP